MISKDAWKRLSDSVRAQAGSLQEKSWASFEHYSVEECIKSGRVSTTIEMITDLESTLRAFKRALIRSLPADEQASFNLSQAGLIEAAAEAQALNAPIE
jgi:hypothetical protein